MLKTAGGVAEPLALPLNPMPTVPPLAEIVEFQPASVTVTFWPDWVQVPSQPPWTDSPDGKVKVNVQWLMAVDPLLVSVTLALNPPGQELLTT